MLSRFTVAKLDPRNVQEDVPVGAFYLRGGVEAALWGRADWGVRVLHAVFDTGSSQHFYVGDRKDALTVGAWDFAFIPVFIHSANERDPLPLQSEVGVWNMVWKINTFKKALRDCTRFTF